MDVEDCTILDSAVCDADHYRMFTKEVCLADTNVLHRRVFDCDALRVGASTYLI